MKRIAYIIPYFGKLPKGCQLWLKTCGMNPTVDWLLFTDDYSNYDYPFNVKVSYCTFEDIKKKIQNCYSFKIALNCSYKLCDFKAAYGEIFEEELEGYDYWGMCDMDLIWGDIRAFLTDEVLEQYERIGNQGHSTLFKNDKDVNRRYRTCIDGILNYKTVYTSEKSFCFDEVGLDKIYEALNIPYYHDVNFAHFRKYDTGFFLDLKPPSEDWKNYRQIFMWDNGKVIRYYLNNEVIEQEEYMYCHFWCRPINYKAKVNQESTQFLIYSDVVCNFNGIVEKDIITKFGKSQRIIFILKMLWCNRKKITAEKVIFNVRGMVKHFEKQNRT